MHLLIEALIARKNIPGTGHNGTDAFVQNAILVLEELGAMIPATSDHPDVRTMSQAIHTLYQPLRDWQRLRKELR